MRTEKGADSLPGLDRVDIQMVRHAHTETDGERGGRERRENVVNKRCVGLHCGVKAESPTFTINSSVSATIKRPLTIELNMSTPWDTDTYYELAVTSSIVGGLPQFKLCNAVVNYAGLNVPCFDPGDQQYIMTTGNYPYDKLTWDLRRIRNAALRSAVCKSFPTVTTVLAI